MSGPFKCELCGNEQMYFASDGHYYCRAPNCPGNQPPKDWKPTVTHRFTDTELAAHDAKIRREAYLRCAQHITSGDDRVWALKNIAATYRKWAEEADRGEK